MATKPDIAARLHEAPEFDPWPEPEPLPGGLLPVPAFDTAMLPDPFKPWIEDIAERMQVPVDFAAVPAMISAGSVIGNRLAIRPKARDDWQELPNLWGMIVGRPGVLKSPTTGQAMKPLKWLEAKAYDAWLAKQAEWSSGAEIREMRSKARKRALNGALRENPNADLSHLRGDDAHEPICQRYRTNDSGYQALGELVSCWSSGMNCCRSSMHSTAKTPVRRGGSFCRHGTDRIATHSIASGGGLTVISRMLRSACLVAPSPARLLPMSAALRMKAGVMMVCCSALMAGEGWWIGWAVPVVWPSPTRSRTGNPMTSMSGYGGER